MKLTELFHIKNFQARQDWLHQFKNKQNIGNKKVMGKSLSANIVSIAHFNAKL